MSPTSFPTITTGEAWDTGPGKASTLMNQITTAVNALETAALTGLWTPGSSGLLAAPFDPMLCDSGGTVTDGRQYITKLYVPTAITVSKIVMFVQTAIGSPTAGRTQVGVYNAAGTLVASATTSATATAWGSTGWATISLTGSVTVGGASAKDYVYVSMITASAGATPVFAKLINALTALVVYQDDATQGARYAFQAVGAGGLQSTITPTSFTTASANERIWFGLAA